MATSWSARAVRWRARAVYEELLAGSPDSLWRERALARRDGPAAPGAHIDEPVEGAAEALLAGWSFDDSLDPDIRLAYARLAAHLVPDDPSVHLAVGDILERERRHAAAIAAYRRVEASSPLAWTARLGIAVNLDDMGDTEAAIALLRAMIDERDERSDALVVLGDVLRVAERYREAVAAYDRAFLRRDEPCRRTGGSTMSAASPWNGRESGRAPRPICCGRSSSSPNTPSC